MFSGVLGSLIMHIKMIIPVGPFFLLTTGTIVNILGQLVTDLEFADPSTHIMPWIKFCSTMAFACAVRWTSAGSATGKTSVRRPASKKHQEQQRAQRRLMTLIGLLDTAAYFLFCLGLAACGAGLASLVLSAAGQVVTSLASRFYLKKRLAVGQMAGLGLVCMGLAIRGLPTGWFGGALAGR
jgi:drug/metabolite transporter (DMT)-like permease